MLRINTFSDHKGEQHAYIRFIKDFGNYGKYKELMRVVGPAYMKSTSVEEICKDKENVNHKGYFFSQQANFCAAKESVGTDKLQYALLGIHINTGSPIELEKTPSYTHPHLQPELISGLVKMGVKNLVITQIDVYFYPVNTAGLLLALGVPREKAMDYMKETKFNVTEKLKYYLTEIAAEDTRESGTDAIREIITSTSEKIKHISKVTWGAAENMTFKEINSDIDL